MDNARRKIRICLVCVVMIAVIVGLIYYFNDVKSNTDMNEGTLVRHYITLDRYHAMQNTGMPEGRG